MKKSLLALAVLGAFAGAASAQQTTSVEVYGLVDMGIVYESGNPAGNVWKLSNGIQSGTRLGFKGSEDLGGGLSAKFQLETGISADTGGFNQGGLAFGRQSWVGLAGGFGTVKLGRQYSPIYQTLDSVDPFGTGLAGSSQNIFTGASTAIPTRINNTIGYSAPAMGGFVADVTYSFGEVIDENKANRQLGAAIGYVNGPILAKLAHHRIENATATDAGKSTLLAGTYDFNVVKAHAAIGWNKGPANRDSTDYLLGVSAPFGASTVLASYIRKNDKTNANQDAHQLALGYTYALSKRTNVYTSYARINNKNGAFYTVGNATEAGTGDKAFNVGIRHKF